MKIGSPEHLELQAQWERRLRVEGLGLLEDTGRELCVRELNRRAVANYGNPTLFQWFADYAWELGEGHPLQEDVLAGLATPSLTAADRRRLVKARVLYLRSQGRTMRSVAEELRLSPATVASHVLRARREGKRRHYE